MNIIDQDSKTHLALQKGFNLRWPPTPQDGAAKIYICTTPEEVKTAANQAISDGYRITVRSGGHCYEGFVSNRINYNEKLAIIDLGEMKGMSYDLGNVYSDYDKQHCYGFKISTGNQNWDGYLSLYKQAGKTIPGGSCYSVGIGGHISGGGYGLMSRLHGLTVDWVTGVDILVFNPAGILDFKHIRADSQSQSEKMLFRACCGSGGGNFGIIINYYFDDLPDAPQQAYWIPLAYEWEKFTLATFTHFLQAYWQWFSDNDQNANNQDITKGNGGLFTLLKLNHRSSSANIVLAIQYTGVNGKVGGSEDAPLQDFIDKMNTAANFTPGIHEEFILPNIAPRKQYRHGKASNCIDSYSAMDWIYVTQTINGSGSNQRGKYKSDYQIENFSTEVCQALWNNLNVGTDTSFKQSLVQIDSYGGKINSNEIGNTSVPQRQSILKSQYQTYWVNPCEDEVQINWIRKIYSEVHANPSSNNKPSRPAYQGCYINYPDIDMKYINYDAKIIDPHWLDLYYGNNTDLINSLIVLKNEIDPNNLFHHELSIPLERPK